MKILIPTDFSAHADVAAEYAARLAKKMKAELVVFNVVHPPGAGKAILKVRDIEEAMTVQAMKDAAYLVNEVKKKVKGKLNMTWKVIRGYPVEYVITNYAKYNDIDLIVMGTKGATGLQKVMLGSNAAAVINRSEVPVITIPELAQFTNIKNIVYATDLKSVTKELRVIVRFVKLFGGKVHVLHVAKPPLNKKVDAKALKAESKAIAASLVKTLKYEKLDFNTLFEGDAAVGISHYVEKHKTDLLAMFTHQLSFIERLRGTGVTRKLAFLAKVPLLSFKKAGKA